MSEWEHVRDEDRAQDRWDDEDEDEEPEERPPDWTIRDDDIAAINEWLRRK